MATLTRLIKGVVQGPKAPAPEPEAAAVAEVNELITAHLNGDSRAFEVLVDRYQVRLLNFVYRMIGDRERAEDLVQEAFLRVYRHLDRFDPARKFSTWPYTIASNLAKNELRNRSRSPPSSFNISVNARTRTNPALTVRGSCHPARRSVRPPPVT